MQTEAIVQAARYLVGLIKAGKIGGIAYRKVAYIGFSIGSVAGVSLSAQYPEAVDAMILHGYSWDVTNLYPGYLAGLQAPVNTLERPEWKKYSSYYQSQSTPASRQAVVFYGDFDPAILPVDFALRDMDALGLALSFGYHLVSAPEFTGPVFIGDGNRKYYVVFASLCSFRYIKLKSKFYQRTLLSATRLVANGPMRHTTAILKHRISM